MASWPEFHPYIRKRIGEGASHLQIAQELVKDHPDAGLSFTESNVRKQASAIGTLTRPQMDDDALHIMREMLTLNTKLPQISAAIKERTGKDVTVRTLQRQARKAGLISRRIRWKKYQELVDGELKSGRTRAESAKIISETTGIRVTAQSLNDYASSRKQLVTTRWTPQMDFDLFRWHLKDRDFSTLADWLNQKNGKSKTKVNASTAKGRYRGFTATQRKRLYARAKRLLVKNDGQLFWDEAKEFLTAHGTLRAEDLRRKKRFDLMEAKKEMGGREAVLRELGRRVSASERSAILTRAIERAYKQTELNPAFRKLAEERFGLGGNEPKTLRTVGDALKKEGLVPANRMAGTTDRMSYETRAKLAENRLFEVLGKTPHIQDLRFFLGEQGERRDADVPTDPTERLFEEIRHNPSWIESLRARANGGSEQERAA